MADAIPKRDSEEKYRELAAQIQVSVDTLKLWKDRGAPVRIPEATDLAQLRQWIVDHLIQPGAAPSFSPQLLNFGFRVGLLLAALVLAGTVIYFNTT